MASVQTDSLEESLALSANGGSRGRRRVVIVGGGFGGIAAAKRLKRADVDVTLIDRTNHQLFQPLLYQVATGALSTGQCAAPYVGSTQQRRTADV